MTKSIIIPDETVISKIYLFRGKKVMIDSDLAEMYGVETRRLNEQIKRNTDRFPEDFMFQLNEEEFEILMSQFATSRLKWGGRRKLPNVFTEHGVLMLSSILNSEKAISINIQIVRIFTQMREMVLTHKDILLELEGMRKTAEDQDERINLIYNYLMQYIDQQEEPRTAIGFRSKSNDAKSPGTNLDHSLN